MKNSPETVKEKFARLHPDYYKIYLVEHRKERNLASRDHYRRLAKSKKRG